MREFIALATLLLGFQILFVFNVYAQDGLIDSKFLEVRPAITSRSDAEKIFGQGDPQKSLVVYKTSKGVVTIDYSYGDCSVGHQPWAIPKGGIEEVSYSFTDNPLPLKSVILNQSAFRKRHIGDVTSLLSYVNDKYGLQVIYDEKLKAVVEVVVSLTINQKLRFSCTS